MSATQVSSRELAPIRSAIERVAWGDQQRQKRPEEVKVTLRNHDQFVVSFNIKPEEIMYNEPHLLFAVDGRTVASIPLAEMSKPEDQGEYVRFGVGQDGTMLDIHPSDTSEGILTQEF